MQWDQKTSLNNIDYSPTTDSQLYYTFDMLRLKYDKKLIISFYQGSSQNIHQFAIQDFDPHKIKDFRDREALSFLFSTNKSDGESAYNFSRYRSDARQLSIDSKHIGQALLVLINTGRFFRDEKAIRLRLKDDSAQKIEMDSGKIFSFELFVSKDQSNFRLQGRFTRDFDGIPLSDVEVYLESGFFFSKNIVYRFDPDVTALSWLEKLIKNPQKFFIPEAEASLFLETVLNSETKVNLPPELQWPVEKQQPKVRALFRTEVDNGRRNLYLKLEFDYDFKTVASFWRICKFIRFRLYWW